MIIWLDAQLAPSLASWMSNNLGVQAQALRDLGLRDAKDKPIYFAARAVDAVILTKDADFVRLLETHGPPPRIIWLTLGNTTNERLRHVLGKHWPRVCTALAAGEGLVEITDDAA